MNKIKELWNKLIDNRLSKYAIHIALIVGACVVLSDYINLKSVAWAVLIIVLTIELAEFAIYSIYNNKKIRSLFDFNKDGKLGSTELICLTVLISIIVIGIFYLMGNVYTMIGSPTGLI